MYKTMKNNTLILVIYNLVGAVNIFTVCLLNCTYEFFLNKKKK